MKRLAIAVAAAAGMVALVASPTGAVATGTLRVSISEKGKFPPGAGTFVLSGRAGNDAGRTAVTTGLGPTRVRDGQTLRVVRGTNHFYGKKGELLIRFTGVSIDIADEADVEYGTWSVSTAFGTGMYEGWRGGGGWASTSKSGRYVVRWEGLITR